MIRRAALSLLASGLLAIACGAGEDSSEIAAGRSSGDAPGESSGGPPGATSSSGGAGAPDADPDDPQQADASATDDTCTTRIEYGNAWIRGDDRTESFDLVEADVSWDGKCIQEGQNSYALLSNGWKPYFVGHGSCVIALDHRGGGCANVASSCSTRVSYGPSWLPAPNHPNFYDDVGGRVASDGVCRNNGGNSSEILDNGWTPTFSGAGACDLSFRYSECGGLFHNAVLDFDCPDPGVIYDGTQYVLTCTGGSPQSAYRVFTSPDLAHWTARGDAFPQGKVPTWASDSFWAPEIHKVGQKYVIYFSARQRSNSRFAIGAGHSDSPTGPFTDLGQPLVTSGSIGLIDANYFESGGKRYVLWKEDGNAVSAATPTPIRIQELGADGLSLVGSATTILNKGLAWEGALIEAPWVVERNGTYAVGVARSSSPTGPYTKRGNPILTTGGRWAGPGHNSVVKTPAGDWYLVYHAWEAGRTNQPPGRKVLVDRIVWGDDGWPAFHGSPSSTSRALP